MFSQNGKISEKQMRRMLILPVYASLIFVIPHLAAWLFGESIVFGLIVFFVFACIYVACIYGLSSRLRKTGEKYGITMGFEKNGTVPVLKMDPAGRLLMLLQVLRLTVRLAFYVCLSVEVLREGQVPFMPKNAGGNVGGFLAALPLLLVALYGAGKCMEKQGRLYELIFWLLFIPLVLVLVFGILEVDFSVFVPKWNVSFQALLFRGYLLLPFLMPVENYLLLRPFLQEKEQGDRRKDGASSFFAILKTVLLVCVLTLFILGIYGIQGAGQKEMLTVAIMRYIRLPLGIVERVDVLLVWFFVIGCFVLVSQTLNYAGMLLSAVFGREKKIWFLVVVLGIALVIAAFLPGYNGALWLYRSCGAVLDVPLSLLIPVIGILIMQAFGDEEELCAEGRDDNETL